MSFQITEAFVKDFRDGITLRAQQMMSRTRMGCRVESGINGTEASFDFIGLRTPTKRTTRHADTVLTDTPHDRRWCTLAVYDDADLIDKPDLVRTLTDPTNPYANAMAMGMGRKIDEVAMAAAIGTAKTGVDGTGSAVLSTSPSHTLGPFATLATANVITTAVLLDEAENSNRRYWAVTAKTLEDLLNDNDVVTADSNTVKVLVSGQMSTWMGFEWIRVEDPILKLDPGTNDRQTIAWSQESLLIGFGSEPMADIGPRRDKNNSTQVMYSMDLGAVRLYDRGVVNVKVDAA